MFNNHRFLTKLGTNKGFVMILTYLLILVLFLLGLAFFAKTTSERKIVNVDKENTQAFNLAEAGMMRAIVYLRANQPSSALDAAFDPFTSGTPVIIDVSAAAKQALCANSNITSCTTAESYYQAMIDPDDSNDLNPESSRFTITAKGASGQGSRTLTVVAQTDNFARYAYFSDDEHFGTGWRRRPVWFVGCSTCSPWSGDQIWGPTHTNGHYHISGNPKFYDATASSDSYITYYHGGPPDDDPQFLGGLTLGANPVPLPHQAIELHTAAVNGGIVFNGDTTIALKSSGIMDVVNAQYAQTNPSCTPCDPVTVECCNVPLPTTKKAVYVSGGNLTLSGTLTGSLTIGSNRNIIINNDIKYSKVPSGSALCTGSRECSSDPAELSMLGIIAEKEVIVSDDAPYNIEIDASVMAMDQSFGVENWDTMAAKGTLTVFGGIIQDQRGPVGTFDSTTNSVATGYSKSYIYDSRFATDPPPYFPQTGDYLKLVWMENLNLGD